MSLSAGVLAAKVRLGPKSKEKDPVDARVDEIRQIMARPEQARERVLDSLLPIGGANPELAAEVADRALARVAYYDKMKPRAYGDPKWEVLGMKPRASDTQRKEFALRLFVGENPLEGVKMLTEGMRSQAVVPRVVKQTLVDLYPEIWAMTQQDVLDWLIDRKTPPTHRERMYLGSQFDLKLDPSLDWTQQVQANYQEIAQEGAIPAGRPEALQNADKPTPGQHAQGRP